MNADEIVKALRRMAPQFQAPGQEVICGAADLIESLQAQLAESQKREWAAVEQIEQQMIFDAGTGREPCEICANAEKTPCIHCKPKWRGSQAGEGGK